MMKKLMMLIPACALLAVAALAAGGIEDPLASLSYLTGTFTTTVHAQVDQRLDASDQELLASAASGTLTAEGTDQWVETRLKEGDILQGSTGTSVLLLAGGGQVTYTTGAVVDVTSGKEVASGTALQADHRYMVAEDTTAMFIVTTKTAVVQYQGGGSIAASSTVDYNAMAAVLKQLNLFRGTLTGYGEGYDLELAPTRLQALIMFIRVLGEEDAALAWSGTTPFTDIAKGSQAEKYVGYAYEKGYTNGFSATQFKPGNAVNAYQYTEFILRAMGYSSSSNTNLADTLNRARIAGVLTAGEAAALQTGKFLRADLVYVSYYALEATMPDGAQTLGQVLISKGIFTEEAWAGAQSLVKSQRM